MNSCYNFFIFEREKMKLLNIFGKRNITTPLNTINWKLGEIFEDYQNRNLLASPYQNNNSLKIPNPLQLILLWNNMISKHV